MKISFNITSKMAESALRELKYFDTEDFSIPVQIFFERLIKSLEVAKEKREKLRRDARNQKRYEPGSRIAGFSTKQVIMTFLSIVEGTRRDRLRWMPNQLPFGFVGKSDDIEDIGWQFPESKKELSRVERVLVNFDESYVAGGNAEWQPPMEEMDPYLPLLMEALILENKYKDLSLFHKSVYDTSPFRYRESLWRCLRGEDILHITSERSSRYLTLYTLKHEGYIEEIDQEIHITDRGKELFFHLDKNLCHNHCVK